MTELVITRGYPGSGKTTYARQWVEQDSGSRVKGPSRDDLRASLFDVEGTGTGYQEQIITTVQQAAVTELIKADQSVIIDDTNLRAQYAKRWAELAAKLGAEFRIEDIKTPLEKCLLNNDYRQWEGGRYVPPEAIRDMAKRFPIERWPEIKAPARVEFEEYVPDTSKPPAYIFDIDGTLAHMTGRSPYDYFRVSEDAPDHVVRDVLLQLSADNSILIVSGREDECRTETGEWLIDNQMCPEGLFMRASGDNRDDTIVKYELFREHIAPNYYVLGVFDDRNKVVDMWRRIGLKCFQVQPGDF